MEFKRIRRKIHTKSIIRRGMGGFTLVEILIAIFILATVLSTIYGAYTGTLRITKGNEASVKAYGMARRAMARMAGDIGAVCPRQGKFTFIHSKEGEREKLTFLSSAHIDFSDTPLLGTASITYILEKGKDAEGLRLIRRDVLYGTDAREEGMNASYTICTGIEELVFTFCDSSGKERESWNSGSEVPVEKDAAPAIVSIRLSIINPDYREGPYTFITGVSILRVCGL